MHFLGEKCSYLWNCVGYRVKSIKECFWFPLWVFTFSVGRKIRTLLFSQLYQLKEGEKKIRIKHTNVVCDVQFLFSGGKRNKVTDYFVHKIICASFLSLSKCFFILLNISGKYSKLFWEDGFEVSFKEWSICKYQFNRYNILLLSVTNVFF